jgi:hypothetical protein
MGAKQDKILIAGRQLLAAGLEHARGPLMIWVSRVLSVRGLIFSQQLFSDNQFTLPP